MLLPESFASYFLRQSLLSPMNGFTQAVVAPTLQAIPQAGLSPISTPLDVGTIINLAQVEKPILYTDWKREQGITSTDPFAVDLMLRNSLPVLISHEALPWTQSSVLTDQENVDDSNVLADEAKPASDQKDTEKKNAPRNQRSEPQNPQFDLITPLIWNALAPRDPRDDREDEQLEEGQPEVFLTN